MEYIILLQQAWQILSRNKVLWLFGLFAVLAGQDALFNLRGAIRLQPLAEALVNLPLPVANAVRLLVPDDAGILAGVALIVVGLVWLALGVIASAALIVLTQAAERGQDVNLKIGVQEGLKHMRTLVGIRLIFNIPASLLSIAVVLFSIRLVNIVQGPIGYNHLLQALQAVGVLPVLLILGALSGIVIGGLGVGADRVCVLEGAGVTESLKRGWEVMRHNLNRYLAVTGIFVASGLLIVFAISCPIAILLTDAIGNIAQAAAGGADLTLMLLSTPIGLIVGLVLLALYALFTAYASVVWTLVYRRYS
jgi:hypothetical protein